MATWVLLHGTPLTPGIWAGVAPALGGDRVVTPDVSRIPHGPDAQEALARTVARDVDADALDVVGHSFGGQIALELALLAPARVRTLTILCSRDTPFPAFAEAARDVCAGRAPSVDAGLARWFRPEELAARGAAVEEARRALEGAAPSDWAAALEAIATYNRASRAADVQAPSMLFAAGHDAVSPPAVMRAFARRVPRAELEVVDEWAHMSPFVDPAALARRLVAARERMTRRRG